jgi:diadenosine tetraphosphate (Ap4A) HIT family hydrolase
MLLVDRWISWIAKESTGYLFVYDFYLGFFVIIFNMKYTDYLKTLTKCPFCYFEGREIIKENNNSLLTFCLAPYHKHHMLVIPKRHTEKIFDLGVVEMNHIYELLKFGTETLKKLGYENITILVREGDGSGKSIPHLHFHVIPNIRIGDIDSNGEERSVLTEEEIRKTISELSII